MVSERYVQSLLRSFAVAQEMAQRTIIEQNQKIAELESRNADLQQRNAFLNILHREMCSRLGEWHER